MGREVCKTDEIHYFFNDGKENQQVFAKFGTDLERFKSQRVFSSISVIVVNNIVMGDYCSAIENAWRDVRVNLVRVRRGGGQTRSEGRGDDESYYNLVLDCIQIFLGVFFWDDSSAGLPVKYRMPFL